MELSHKLAVIRQRINQLGSFQGEKKKVVISETEIQLNNVREIYNKMEQLAKTGTRDRTRKMQQKLRTHEADLTRLQRDLQHASLLSPTTPQTTYSDSSDDYQVKELDHRQKILSGTAKLDESTDRLTNAHRIAVSTEEIGTNVLGEMVGQRRQLEGIRDNVDLVSDSALKARTVISSMGRRVVTNKLILAIIILVLLVINGAIIYIKWINPLIKNENKKQ